MQIQREGAPIPVPELMAQLLTDHSSVPITRAVAALVMAAVRGSEDTKCAIMDSQFPERALAVAGAAADGPGAPPLDVAVALLTALSGAITADDARPPASKAFMNARVCAAVNSLVLNPSFLLHFLFITGNSCSGANGNLRFWC
jgi:hypothetical protein